MLVYYTVTVLQRVMIYYNTYIYYNAFWRGSLTGAHNTMRRYNIIVIRLADLRGNGFLLSTHVDGLQRTRNCIDYNERVTALHYSVRARVYSQRCNGVRGHVIVNNHCCDEYCASRIIIRHYNIVMPTRLPILLRGLVCHSINARVQCNNAVF